MAQHHKFGERSKAQLESCHPDLREVFNCVLKKFPLDITVIEGYRSNERQEEMFATGRSQLRAGQGKHNRSPSRAVDVAPLVAGKIEWDNRDLWLQFAGFVLGVAAMMDIELTWGGDWDGDFNCREHSLFDAPHFELKN